jgi:hypothetical protein
LKKVIDALFTARWAIKNGHENLTYNKITEALEYLGVIKKEVPVEEERLSDRPQDLDFDPPRFETVKGIKYKEIGKYQTPSGMFEGLVVHYTVSGRARKNAIGVVSYMASKNIGCMVMDEDGIIYIPEDFDVLRDAAFHAGKSSWNGKEGLSRYFAGMEICCWGRSDRSSKIYTRHVNRKTENMAEGWYEPYTVAQERALENFVKWARSVNPEFKIENLVGHDEVAPGRKTDPGGSLSMSMSSFRGLFV